MKPLTTKKKKITRDKILIAVGSGSTYEEVVDRMFLALKKLAKK